MTKTHKIVLAAVCVLVIVPTIFMFSCAFRIDRHRQGFSQIQLGQSKETAINTMGQPAEIRKCSFSIYNRNRNPIGECAEIIAYQGVYEQWALAVDSNGKVIEKYYWFLGEYGNRPPDTN